MSRISDLPVLWSMLRGMSRRGSQAAQLEGFYANQATAYDRFRERLLHGRDELLAQLPLSPGSRLVELGAGTGRNLEALGGRASQLASAHLVDLCPSLLAQARNRLERLGWRNAEVVEADATTWRPPQPVDVVLCAYSLTMMPDWRAVVANACAMLKPDGVLAVVDFTLVDDAVARLSGAKRQSGVARWAWRRWFSHDGVRPDAALLLYLADRLRIQHLSVRRAGIPYLPFTATYASLMAQRSA